MRISVGRCILLCVSVCTGLAGCGSGPKIYQVSGTVTLDGKPLEEGDIYFESQDPGISSDAGKINNGKFSFRSKAGKKKVLIRATRIVPGKKTPMGSPWREEAIPARYNDRSQLTEEVPSPDGKNNYEFKLESKR